MKLEKLQIEYANICTEYINRFCKKQDVEFNGWVANMVGETACVSDYFINFSDIKYDIDTSQQKELIFSWYNDMLDAHTEGKDTINYYSYSKGLRLGINKN